MSRSDPRVSRGLSLLALAGAAALLLMGQAAPVEKATAQGPTPLSKLGTQVEETARASDEAVQAPVASGQAEATADRAQGALDRLGGQVGELIERADAALRRPLESGAVAATLEAAQQALDRFAKQVGETVRRADEALPRAQDTE